VIAPWKCNGRKWQNQGKKTKKNKTKIKWPLTTPLGMYFKKMK
jgi:hypothetical protein